MKERVYRVACPALVVVLALTFALAFATACGGGSQSGGESSGSEASMSEASVSEGSEASTSGTSMMEATSETSGLSGTTMMETSDSSTDLSSLEVGPKENSNMIPARGIEKAESRPLPDDPPEGIEVSPATVSTSTRDDIDYDNDPSVGPPSHGAHAPLWQNCGFYTEPVNDRNAVHSLDHGSVWLTYRPDLPQNQLQTLRRYASEPYVLVSPYPDQSAPVVATSWRLQLPLEGASDPRLKQYVDGFRLSAIAPLAGNGCIKGLGDPEVSAPASYYLKGRSDEG